MQVIVNGGDVAEATFATRAVLWLWATWNGQDPTIPVVVRLVPAQGAPDADR